MPKHYYTYTALIGLISSLILGFFIQNSWLLFVYIGLGIFGALFFLPKLSKKTVIPTLLVPFVFLSILGGFRLENTIYKDFGENHITQFLDQKIEIEGKIITEVDERADNIKYTLEVDLINEQKGEGKILFVHQKYPRYEYGDVLAISGTLKTPSDEEDFSYKNYLSRYEIYGILHYGKVEKIAHNPESEFLSWLYQQKQSFLDAINQKYREPESSFLAGLLIGARKGMGEEVTQNFQATGLSHIVAVSGSNITILLAVIITLLGFLPRLAALAVSLISIVVFTVFVGMSAAVVRAAIMGIIGLMAVNLGRPQIPLMALLITVATMGYYQPKMLIYDVGLQLSVFAVIGVIWLVPLFPKFFQSLPEHFGVKEAVALTLAAQLTTLPVSLYHFQTFSLIAPLANLFVVPTIPFAMLFGFLSLIPIPFISDIFALFTTFLLSVSLFFANFFSNIPFAYFENISASIWFIIAYCIALFGGMFWLTKKQSELSFSLAENLPKEHHSKIKNIKQ